MALVKYCSIKKNVWFYNYNVKYEHSAKNNMLFVSNSSKDDEGKISICQLSGPF